MQHSSFIGEIIIEILQPQRGICSEDCDSQSGNSFVWMEGNFQHPGKDSAG